MDFFAVARKTVFPHQTVEQFFTSSFILEIKPFIVLQVPRNDHRYSARKLSIEKNAKALAKELGLL